MILTVQGLIEIAPEEEAKLWAYGRLFGKAERSLQAALERKEIGEGAAGRHGSKTAMRDWVMERFAMTNSQAASVATRVRGMRGSAMELRKMSLKEFAGSANGKKKGKVNAAGHKVAEKIRDAEEAQRKAKEHRQNAEKWRSDDAGVSLDYMRQAYKQDALARRALWALSGLRRRAFRLDARFERLWADEKSGRLRICFGGKKLFDQRNRIGEPSCPFRTHAEWRAAWDAARDGSIFCEGHAQSVQANPEVRVAVEGDAGFSVRASLPRQLRDEHGKQVVFRVRWNEQLRPWVDALACAGKTLLGKKADWGIHREAISYRLKYRHDKKRWYVLVTLDISETPGLWSKRLGAIGLDLNALDLAMARVDGDGNLQERKTYRLPGSGAKAGTLRSVMGHALQDVMRVASEKGVPVVIEGLDFSKKKSELRSEPKKRARMLSGLAYAFYLKNAESRAKKDGVGFIRINPAFTSVKGMALFARRLGLSSGEAAAMVIARQGIEKSWDRVPPRWAHPAGQRTSGMCRLNGEPWAMWQAISQVFKAIPRHELCFDKGKVEAVLTRVLSDQKGAPKGGHRKVSTPPKGPVPGARKVAVKRASRADGDGAVNEPLPCCHVKEVAPLVWAAVQPGLFDQVGGL